MQRHLQLRCTAVRRFFLELLAAFAASAATAAPALELGCAPLRCVAPCAPCSTPCSTPCELARRAPCDRPCATGVVVVLFSHIAVTAVAAGHGEPADSTKPMAARSRASRLGRTWSDLKWVDWVDVALLRTHIRKSVLISTRLLRTTAQSVWNNPGQMLPCEVSWIRRRDRALQASARARFTRLGL
jgi:hypothetical protein